MKQLAYHDLKDMTDLSLIDVIDSWREYDTETVTLAYSVLKRRESNVPERHKYKIVQFMEANSISNINSYANNLLKNKQLPMFAEIEEERIFTPNKSFTPNNQTNRYPALSTISSLFYLLGWIIGLFALVLTISHLTNEEASITNALISFLGGAVATLILLAASEIIQVFIDIEKNTRTTS